ncbi:MAG: DUF1232 domain-containing protein [Erysipelotrichaceae bacterium]|nr:DUF1232 domain-containing protein [Erysipelotrichaceae bacterium]
MEKITENKASEILEKGFGAAEDIVKNPDKLERFLQRLETKLKDIPMVGDKLSMLAVMASLLRAYAVKEYTDIPIGSVIAMVSALIYFLSPVDLIPDAIPILGYSDDVAVAAVCWKMVESDVKEYEKWREESGKTINL